MRKTTQNPVRILDVPRETRTECLLKNSPLVRLWRLAWKRNGPGAGCINAQAETGVVSSVGPPAVREQICIWPLSSTESVLESGHIHTHWEHTTKRQGVIHLTRAIISTKNPPPPLPPQQQNKNTGLNKEQITIKTSKIRNLFFLEPD